jgi:hypothetical protein
MDCNYAFILACHESRSSTGHARLVAGNAGSLTRRLSASAKLTTSPGCAVYAASPWAKHLGAIALSSFAGNRVVKHTSTEFPVFQVPIGFISRAELEPTKDVYTTGEQS